MYLKEHLAMSRVIGYRERKIVIAAQRSETSAKAHVNGSYKS